MDIRFVTRFLAVAEHGSLNKASQHLNLSQPALSKSIQLMEESLGVQLIDRGPRGVSLTSFGETVFDHASRIAAEVRKMEDAIEAIRTLSYGEINVGAPLGPDSRNLAVAILRLVEGTRRISINVSSGSRNELIRPLLLGDLDFMISTLFDPDDIPADVDQQELYLDAMTLAVRAGHPLLDSPMKLPLLSRYPWIALSINRDMEGALRKIIDKKNRSSMLRSGSPAFVKNILLRSDFIGLVRQDSVSIELKNKTLIEIDISSAFNMAKLFPPQKVGLIYRGNVSLSNASQALIVEINKTISLATQEAADLPTPVKILA